MDTDFPDLYALVNMAPSAEVLATRWTAVASLAELTTQEQIGALVRVSGNAAGAETTAVIEAAREADPAFQSVGSAAELRVLASAALCHVFRTSSCEADAAALAALALGLDGTQGDELSRHVQGGASVYLHDEALQVRSEKATSKKQTAAKREASLKQFREGAAAAGQNLAALAEPIASIVTAHHSDAIEDLTRGMQALREESNMLWWLLAEYSQHLKARFVDIGVPASCLVAARELAEMTILLPGPRSASALLDRMLASAGDSSGVLSIADAVNATPRPWRENWIKGASLDSVGNLAPVLLAVRYSLETESAKDWISSFEKGAGIVDPSLQAPSLARQAYTEALLVRAFSTVGD